MQDSFHLMLYFPQFYPDELVGSWIIRACRHTGLSRKRILEKLTGSRRNSYSLFLGTACTNIAKVVALHPSEVLWKHSAFPYLVAFMPLAQIKKYEAKLLAGSYGDEAVSMDAFSSGVTKGVPFRRYCLMCVQEELVSYGETYWHRSHLLPVTHYCSLHKIALIETIIPVRGFCNLLSYSLPHETKGRTLDITLPPAVQIDLAIRSEHYMHSHSIKDINWNAAYRDFASVKGYRFKTPFIASAQMAQDLLSAYGGNFLEYAGCYFNRKKKNPWPALMVREYVSNMPFAPAKHILIQTFLEFCNSESKAIHHTVPGKKSRNYTVLDEVFAQKINTQIQKIKKSEKQLKISELLTKARCWSTFRHERKRLPQSVALVEKFKSSNNSLRCPKKYK